MKFQGEISSVWWISGAKICGFCMFILLKKMWLNLWFVTALCKTPMEFLAMLPVSAHLCGLQPWQHSLYQWCWCIWDHFQTLLLIVIMAKVSSYSRKRMEISLQQGLHPAEILFGLKCEGLQVSFSSITCINKKLHLTSSMANLPQLGRPQKWYMEAKTFVDQQMGRGDKTTSNKIKEKLEWHGICMSASTICRVFDSIIIYAYSWLLWCN